MTTRGPLRIRHYRHQQDYERVNSFLIGSYRPGEVLSTWLQARWEYMHHIPIIDRTDVGKIGLAEVAGELVGVVHFEHDEGQIFFQVDPNYPWVKEPLLDYAEATFGSSLPNGSKRLLVFIDDFDRDLAALAASRGYRRLDWAEETSRRSLAAPLPEPALPPGFRLQSLAEENDYRKINQVLWRGFDHPGPPPDEEIEGRRRAQQAPNFRRDLNIVVVSPEGRFVAYAGHWYLAANHVVYVEPVATDPDYRRLGLGRAAVLEGLRRAQRLGAEVAWVGSSLPFYRAMGFVTTYGSWPWAKEVTPQAGV